MSEETKLWLHLVKYGFYYMLSSSQIENHSFEQASKNKKYSKTYFTGFLILLSWLWLVASITKSKNVILSKQDNKRY